MKHVIRSLFRKFDATETDVHVKAIRRVAATAGSAHLGVDLALPATTAGHLHTCITTFCAIWKTVTRRPFPDVTSHVLEPQIPPLHTVILVLVDRARILSISVPQILVLAVPTQLFSWRIV